MAPPRLSLEQVVCGPHLEDEQDSSGRWISMRTPSGVYDLTRVAGRLPAEQRPDAVVCLVDGASWMNVPRNLAGFNVPKVLLIADTHHQSSPLRGMVDYTRAESFDRVVVLYGRHHIPLLKEAGLTNLFWFPGLTFPFRDADVVASRSAGRERNPVIAFVGQAGGDHPQRRRMFQAMAAARLPVRTRAVRQPEGLRFYGESLIGFNASLNGDLNLRVFEILASGAALLTDRLSRESGLDVILQDGIEFQGYEGAQDLVARSAHLLSHPDEAVALGAKGAAWFDAHFSEARRMEAFQALVVDGHSHRAFTLPDPRARVFLGSDPESIYANLGHYEAFQELHRHQERVRVTTLGTGPEGLERLLRSLPRVDLVPAGASPPAEVVLFDRRQADDPQTRSARVPWPWDGTRPKPPELRVHRVSCSGIE